MENTLYLQDAAWIFQLPPSGASQGRRLILMFQYSTHENCWGREDTTGHKPQKLGPKWPQVAFSQAVSRFFTLRHFTLFIIIIIGHGVSLLLPGWSAVV